MESEVKYKPGTLEPAKPLNRWRRFWWKWQYNVDTWPTLDFRIRLLPWHWRFRFYFINDIQFTVKEHGLHIEFGPLVLDAHANVPYFVWDTPLSLRTEDEKYKYTEGGLQ